MIRVGREKLSGKVQVDDAFVGGEEPVVKGRQSFKKARIVVGVEIKEGNHGLGRIHIQYIPAFSATSLVPFVIHSHPKNFYWVTVMLDARGRRLSAGRYGLLRREEIGGPVINSRPLWQRI